VKFANLALTALVITACRASSSKTMDELPPTEPAGIFSTNEPITLTIEAPFSDMFYLARMGVRDRPTRPIKRVKKYNPGILKGKSPAGDFSLPIQIKVRGNSSLADCTFAKLKIKIDKEAARGTVFEQADEVKVGSHCDNDFDKEHSYTMAGRYLDPIATHREAYAYSVLNLLGLVAPKSRPAVITYVDTSEDSWERPIKRHAFLFEDIEVVASNLGGLEIRDEDKLFEPEEVDAVDRDAALKLYFAETLIGNWDWNLTLDREQVASKPDSTRPGERREHLWNMDILTAPNGKTIPVPADFDLATIVNDFLRMGMVPDDFLTGESNSVRFRANILKRATKYFPTESLTEMRKHFEGRKGEILAHVETYPLDDKEKDRLKRHIDQFYRALSVLNF
jgi:hypothetical protein